MALHGMSWLHAAMEGGLSGHLEASQGQPTTNAIHNFIATLPLSDRLVWFFSSSKPTCTGEVTVSQVLLRMSWKTSLHFRFFFCNVLLLFVCKRAQDRPCKAVLGLAGMELTFPRAALRVLKGALPTPMKTSSF